jgi:hypothetical protein
MSTSPYSYPPHIERQIGYVGSLAIGLPGITFSKATMAQDFGGIDAHYILDQRCPFQVRCRWDRPCYAPDVDVTFRLTEPPMIEAGTYAPLMLFLWFRDDVVEHGELIDVYRMYPELDPPLAARPPTQNRHGTRSSWVTVTNVELFKAQALLRVGDDHQWAPVLNGGDKRVREIIALTRRVAS